MTHDEYQQQISQLIDGELGEQFQPALFVHLGTCAECRRFLNSTLTLRSSLSSAAQIAILQGLDLRMRDATVAPAPIFFINTRPAAFRLALAASIAFILLMGSLLFGPQILKTQQLPNETQTQGLLLPQQN